MASFVARRKARKIGQSEDADHGVQTPDIIAPDQGKFVHSILLRHLLTFIKIAG